MHIISKYKDYFDYLVGIWGCDEKLVLDRTVFNKILPDTFTNNRVYSIHICGWQYDFLYKGGEFYYLDEVAKLFPRDKKKDRGTRYYRSFLKDKLGDGVYIPTPEHWSNYDWCYTERVPSKVNDVLDCPILLERYTIGGFYKGVMTIQDYSHGRPADFLPFPILKDIEFHKALSPEDCWLLLSDWLSKKKDVVIVEKQTDKQKILGKGFDLIKSFRHRK